MIPGEILYGEGEIALNDGLASIEIDVANVADRPIQVGSHYHFFETNPGLSFAREAASGTAVRFEPGQTRKVRLIPLRGLRRVVGFRGAVMGAL